MGKTFYSEYINHCLRFFARHPHPNFRNDADKENWKACEKALKSFSNTDREMLIQIYAGGDTISDNIYTMAKEKGINQDALWKLVKELERKVAKRRGLL